MAGKAVVVAAAVGPQAAVVAAGSLAEEAAVVAGSLVAVADGPRVVRAVAGAGRSRRMRRTKSGRDLKGTATVHKHPTIQML